MARFDGGIFSDNAEQTGRGGRGGECERVEIRIHNHIRLYYDSGYYSGGNQNATCEDGSTAFRVTK